MPFVKPGIYYCDKCEKVSIIYKCNKIVAWIECFCLKGKQSRLNEPTHIVPLCQETVHHLRIGL